MWRILFFIVLFYLLLNSTNKLFAKESDDYLILFEPESGHKSEDFLVKTESVLLNIVKANSKFIHLPELYKYSPIPDSKKTIVYPEFSFIRTAKDFLVPTAAFSDTSKVVKAVFIKNITKGRWISFFANETIQVIPVGIKKEIYGLEYKLGFTKFTVFLSYHLLYETISGNLNFSPSL